jgi:hypothetical protein
MLNDWIKKQEELESLNAALIANIEGKEQLIINQATEIVELKKALREPLKK